MSKSKLSRLSKILDKTNPSKIDKSKSKNDTSVSGCLVGWLFWAYRPFETAFQSISGRPQREGERKEK